MGLGKSSSSSLTRRQMVAGLNPVIRITSPILKIPKFGSMVLSSFSAMGLLRKATLWRHSGQVCVIRAIFAVFLKESFLTRGPP